MVVILTSDEYICISEAGSIDAGITHLLVSEAMITGAAGGGFDNEMVSGSPVKKCRSSSSVKSDKSDSSVASSKELLPSSYSSGSNSKLAPSQIAGVWKEVTLNRLLLLVELPTLDGVLAFDAVDGKIVLQNVSHILSKLFSSCKSNSNSTSSTQPLFKAPSLLLPGRWCKSLSSAVGRISYRQLSQSVSSSSSSTHTSSRESESLSDVPRWVILAMRCLSKWPNGCSEELFGGMPIYCGYEFDVLQSLVKYFTSLPDSLISPKLSDLLLAILKLIKGGKRTACDALQLSTLLLPQTNRMRLHRVLRLINKAGANTQLRLSKNYSNTQVLLETFSSVVLKPPTTGGSSRLGSASSSSSSGRTSSEEWREDSKILVGYMAQHYHQIFKVPEDISEEVQRRLTALSSSKDKDPPIKASRTFCARVSESQYEEQKRSTSHSSIAALLEGILEDQTMSSKVKKQRLKMFQKQYPDIYAEKCAEISSKSNPSVSATLSRKRRSSIGSTTHSSTSNRQHQWSKFPSSSSGSPHLHCTSPLTPFSLTLVLPSRSSDDV